MERYVTRPMGRGEKLMNKRVARRKKQAMIKRHELKKKEDKADESRYGRLNQ